MGLYMNEEESLKMFSMADSNQNNYIEEWEFARAITLIKLQIGRETLRKLGITSEDLIW